MAPDSDCCGSLVLFRGAPLASPYSRFASSLSVRPSWDRRWRFCLPREHMDLQRWTMFREIQAKDEEARITHGLLRLAQALDSAVGSEKVPEVVARSTRELLEDSEWCVLLLPVGKEDCFRVAAGDASRADLLQEARGLEVRLQDYAPLARLRELGGLVEIPRDVEPDPRWAAIMAYFRIRVMMVTSMVRGKRIVGLLAAGRGRHGRPFSPEDRRALRGAAAQAAAAIEKTRASWWSSVLPTN